MIERPPVSKADFHDRTFVRQIEIGLDVVEDIALRGQPANETVQSAHSPSVHECRAFPVKPYGDVAENAREKAIRP
jgi:hypothetical protein